MEEQEKVLLCASRVSWLFGERELVRNRVDAVKHKTKKKPHKSMS